MIGGLVEVHERPKHLGLARHRLCWDDRHGGIDLVVSNGTVCDFDVKRFVLSLLLCRQLLLSAWSRFDRTLVLSLDPGSNRSCLKRYEIYKYRHEYE